MSQTSESSTTAAAAEGASAESPRVKAFVLVFAIAVPLLYAIGDIAGLPLFTYHPGTGQFEWGFGLPRKDEGPAMYWYGWVAMCTLGGGLLGGIAAWLAPRFAARLPMDLTWLAPVVLTPFMIYSLNYYWRW